MLHPTFSVASFRPKAMKTAPLTLLIHLLAR